jgi:hypothetical protein
MAPADPLTELRDRVHAAQAAAERLAAEARSQSRELPRQNELEALVGLLWALRELVPPERQQQVSDLLRHVLLLLRAIIDFWVERLDPPPAGRVEVQDIPID